MTTVSPLVDLAAVKARQQQMWNAAGDYTQIGSRILITAELLCEAVDLRAGQKVLDVATGTGNCALAAARRFCEVTGVDYSPALLERARLRAEVEGLPVTFQYGDAEDLPFAAGSFDVVLSTCGVMFAPNQEQAAQELLRVCRPGGEIGMVNWTPGGFLGGLFQTIGRYVPPTPGLKPAVLWGTEERIRELFSDGIQSLQINKRSFYNRYRSPQHYVDFWQVNYGPLQQAFAALDEAGQAKLAQDVVDLVLRFNQADDGTAVWPQDYLEIVITRS